MYRIGFTKAALAEWKALDGSVREAFRKALKKRLENPHVPSSALMGSPHNCYKIKLQKAGYRLVYTVQDDVLVVIVLAVGKRERSKAYTLAIQRLLRSYDTENDQVDV